MLATAESWIGAMKQEPTQMSGVKDFFFVRNNQNDKQYICEVVKVKQLRLHPNVKHILLRSFKCDKKGSPDKKGFLIGISKKASQTSNRHFCLHWMHQLAGILPEKKSKPSMPFVLQN